MLTKYLDFHTGITALVIVAIVVLKLARADVPVELYVLLAAVSPGIVLKGRAQRDEEQAESLRGPPPDDPPAPPTTKEAA
jgi:hypothetical protein